MLHQRLYQSLSDIQTAFDRWQHVYNFKRPHQGINNQVPASRYQPSPRALPDQLVEVAYGQDCTVRKVSRQCGMFRFRGRRYRAGKGLSGEYIALKETDQPDVFALYFMDTFIKPIRLSEGI